VLKNKNGIINKNFEFSFFFLFLCFLLTLTIFIMKQLLLIGAFMLSVVSFANQTKEDVKTSVDLENNIENVVVEETSAYCTTTLYGYWVVSKKSMS
jgi:hypothetical protein